MEPRPRKTSLRMASAARTVPASSYGNRIEPAPKAAPLVLKKGKKTLIIPDPRRKSGVLRLPDGREIKLVCLGAASISGSRPVIRIMLDWRNRKVPTKQEMAMLLPFARKLRALGWSLETR